MQPTDVRDAAQTAARRSKSFFRKQVDERSTRIGEQFGSVAREMRTVRGKLRRRGAPAALAFSLDLCADSAEQLGNYLQCADGERLIADFQALVRRRQWEFASAALVLGFAAGRLLKRSGAQRPRADDLAGDGGGERDAI